MNAFLHFTGEKARTEGMCPRPGDETLDRNGKWVPYGPDTTPHYIEFKGFTQRYRRPVAGLGDLAAAVRELLQAQTKKPKP